MFSRTLFKTIKARARIMLCMLTCGLASGSALAEEIHIATGEYAPWASAELAHDGITNRLVKEAFALEGVDVVFHYMPWKRALEATKVGKYAATSFWSYSDLRKEDFLHSAPLTNLNLSLFHRKDAPINAWSQLAELNTLRFGATLGYTYTDEFWELERNGILRVSVSNSDLDNFKKLLNRQIDIFPISTYTGWYLLAKHFSETEVAAITTQQAVIASNIEYLLFSKQHEGNAEMIERFNRGLAVLQKKGALEQYTQELLSTCCSSTAPAP